MLAQSDKSSTMRTVTVLGIESSCDDTAAAVVVGQVDANGLDPPGEILSNVVVNQDMLHQAYGGVVPEIAARAHVERADHVVAQALSEAGCELAQMDAVAVTAGPGLMPGLLAGVMTARGVAAGSGLELVAVNHLAAHALTARLTEPVDFPYLLLLASGGHCLFAAVESPFQCTVYGTTRDDAPGEAFDKIARLLELGFPGGPALANLAQTGDANRFELPRPLRGQPGCDMSFSGLKTAARRTVVENNLANDRIARCDLAAAFQAAVHDVLVDRTRNAVHLFRQQYPECHVPQLAIAGGVMANRLIREGIAGIAGEEEFAIVFPPPALCTDNGAMVAWAGLELRVAGISNPPNFPVRARWPLDELWP